MRKNWEQLFVGYGFEVKELAEGMDLSHLTKGNRNFLNRLLEHMNCIFIVTNDVLEIETEVVTEDEWLVYLEKYTDGRTEKSFAPTEISVEQLDTFISGLVMQLNRLECQMVYSCDGHEVRRPSIRFVSANFARQAKSILEYVGLESRRSGSNLIFSTDRKELPNAAIQLAELTEEHAKELVQEREAYLSKEQFNKNLTTVLNIPGESGNERLIRAFVLKALEPYADHMTVDHYGNIIAEKKFGAGPTVLLNAHLDTYERIMPDRYIIKDGDIWSSSEGILGADDRAGVNIVLAVAQTVNENLFKGTIKYVFTVEEEIGLRGAKEVTKSFLWDVDMAFVIDRRGTNDIVVSRGSDEPFCSPTFGTELERIARGAGYHDWKTVAGGSSDTYIWSQSSIESVNLSAGYLYEHTFAEQLDVGACYETYQYLMEILNASSGLRNQIRRIERVS